MIHSVIKYNYCFKLIIIIHSDGWKMLAILLPIL